MGFPGRLSLAVFHDLSSAVVRGFSLARMAGLEPGRTPRPADATLVAALLVLLLTVRPAAADTPEIHIGKPVVSQSVLVDDRPTADPMLMRLIETEVGVPLDILQVRESIVHLFSLGLYHDVQVNARALEGGVALVYHLRTMPDVGQLIFRGDLGLSERALRRALVERFGRVPAPGRGGDVAGTLQQLYRDRGYLAARVDLLTEAAAGGESTLVIEISSGPRARIGEVTIRGNPLLSRPALLRRLNLEPGQPYEPPAVERRLSRYAEEMRSRGHYEAVAEHTAEIREAGRLVDLTLEVHPGPLVRVTFEGDPLPADRRAELVPIRREGSVDEDLLEDSSRRIESYLQAQGHWKARAEYSRDFRDGEMIVTFRIRSGPVYRVEAVDISGNVAMPAADLQSMATVKPGEVFIESRLDADVAAILERYRRQGFADVKIDSSIAETGGVSSGSRGTMAVTPRIVITEGPRISIGTVTFTGSQAFEDQELRSVTRSVAGSPYYRPQVMADREALQMTYLNRGFQTAQIEVETAFSDDGARADLTFVIREGVQVLIDHILIVGNTRTAARTIHRELLLRPGEPLGLQDAIESQWRLTSLGLFRRVRITELTHGAPDRRDVIVSVEEAPATSIGYGGGLEGGRRLRRSPDEDSRAVERLEFAPRGFFEIGRRNLWGKNRSADLFTRMSLRRGDPEEGTGAETGALGFSEYRVLGTFREPRAFGWNADVLVSGFLEQSIRSSFNLNRRGAHAQLIRRITPTISVTGRYTHLQNRLFNERFNPEDQPLIDRLFPEVRLSTLSSGLVRDTRDDALDPSAGELIGLEGELATRSIGSEVGFAKTFMQGFLYRRVSRERRIIVAAGARLGLATGFPREVMSVDADGNPLIGPDGRQLTDVLRDLPASERFFAGGDRTVRGFALDRLGDAATIDQDGFPKGGNALVVLNAELRIPVSRGLGVVGFLDAGNVFAKVEDLNLGNIRRGAGFGLRYQSPIGPIRFDLGFNVNRREGERLATPHISIGHAF
jgi:outer membrane protein insertion porin family